VNAVQSHFPLYYTKLYKEKMKITNFMTLPLALLSTAMSLSNGESNEGGMLRRVVINDNPKETVLTLKILNLSYRQPFSPFFIMVHNSEAEPLFTLGQPASNQLAQLAEIGNTNRLINYYTNNNPKGVKSATRFHSMTKAGGTSEITVSVSDEYPMISIAAMCENTNDCFVGLSGVNVTEGMVVYEPGLDAGSEENNESCDSVPGPFCIGKGNQFDRSRNGEGFIHIHRGIVGDGDLDKSLDWRNPMMRVVVEKNE